MKNELRTFVLHNTKMIESLMPSEVARLVLGYLKEKECIRTIGAFLVESPDLKEYFECLQRGREHSTKIGGKSLLDVLNEYCAMTNLSNIGNSEVKEVVNRMESSVSRCKYLLQNCSKNHGKDVAGGHQATGVNLHSIAKRASSRISLTVARQSQDKQNSVSSSTSFVPVPIILNTSRKTSILERAFGSSNREAKSGESPEKPLVVSTVGNTVTAEEPVVEPMAISIISPSTDRIPDADVSNVAVEIVQPCPVVNKSVTAVASTSGKQLLKSFDCHSNGVVTPLGTPAKLRILSESSSSKSPRRKSNTPRKLGGNTPLVKSTNVTTPNKDKVDCPKEETADLNALLDELLQNTALHERIADNINKVVGTADATQTNGQQSVTVEKELRDSCLSQQEQNVPNDVIKDIIDRTECDPAFEAFMNLICGKPDYSSADGNSCSPVSILSDAMSNLDTECSSTRSPYVESLISSVEVTPAKMLTPEIEKLDPHIPTAVTEPSTLLKDIEGNVSESVPQVPQQNTQMDKAPEVVANGSNLEENGVQEGPIKETSEIKEVEREDVPQECVGDKPEEQTASVGDLSESTPAQLTTLTAMECDSFPVLHIPEVSGCSPLKNLGLHFGIDPSFVSSTVLFVSNSATYDPTMQFHNQPQFVKLAPGSILSFTNVPTVTSNMPMAPKATADDIQDPKKQMTIRPRVLKRQQVGGKIERPAKRASLSGNVRQVYARSLDVINTSSDIATNQQVPCATTIVNSKPQQSPVQQLLINKATQDVQTSDKQPHVRILDFATPRKDNVTVVPGNTKSGNNDNAKTMNIGTLPNMVKMSPASLEPVKNGPGTVSKLSKTGKVKDPKVKGGEKVKPKTGRKKNVTKSSKKKVVASGNSSKATTDKEVAETLVSLASGIPPTPTTKVKPSNKKAEKEKAPAAVPCPSLQSGEVKKPNGKTKNILSKMDVDMFLSKLHYVE